VSVYEVEIECMSREVYQVEAETPDEARANWTSGDLVISEVTSVEGVVAVTQVEPEAL
jgi:hypothetical protein